MFSSRNFIVSGLTFRSLIYFEFIFVYGVRKEKIGLKIYWAWPRWSEQDPSVSLSHQEAPEGDKPLILLQERADRLKTIITEN